MNLASYGVSNKGKVMFFIINNYKPYQTFNISDISNSSTIRNCGSLISILSGDNILFKEGRGKYSHKFGGNEFLAILKVSQYLKDRPCKSRFSVSYLINIFSNVCNSQSIWRSINFLHIMGCIKKMEKGRYLVLDRGFCAVIHQWLLDRNKHIEKVKNNILQKTETSIDRVRLECYNKYFDSIDYSVFKNGCNLFNNNGEHIAVVTPQINLKSYVIYTDNNIQPISILWNDIISIRSFLNNIVNDVDFIADTNNNKIWSKVAILKKIEAKDMLSDIINEGYEKQINIKIK